MTATTRPASIGYLEFVILMALITSTVAMSTDAVMPALPAIGDALDAGDDNRRQLVIGVLFFGLAISQVLFGPLSDSFGRRSVLFSGLALFAVGCLISIYAPTFEVMLLGRFIQGFGAGGPRVVSMAVIRDRFDGRQMAKTISLIMTIFILVPVFAPAIGQLILEVADWEAIFGLYLGMAGATVLWIAGRLPETLRPEHRHPLTFRRTYRAFREVLANRSTMGYLMAAAFVFSAFLGYLTSAQQILQELYGLGDRFPIAFGGLAGSLGFASFVNSRLVIRLGTRMLAHGTLKIMIALSIAFVGATWFFDGVPPLWLLFVILVPMFFCNGVLFGNLNAMAMQPMAHIAGATAAVVGAGTTVISTVFGSSVGQAFDGTLFPLAIAFTGFSILSLACCLWARRGVPENSS